MISLLDANVLIALFDSAHVHHEAAHDWLARHRGIGWATCPLTQNACIRILSQPSYPGRLPVADITRRLARAVVSKDHRFWSDDVSLCDSAVVDLNRVLSSSKLTDIYLLALAANNGGRLVTFDAGIQTDAVLGFEAKHLIVLTA